MNDIEAMQMMQMEINDQKIQNRQAIAALKLCMRELRGWVKAYGTDLDTQEALIEATKVLNSASK